VRVSIVINNYNYGEFVERSIESALGQTHPNVEVIVVDDGSSDDSVDKARAFGSRIQLITKSNGGQGSAYNAGFASVTGEIVIFLDADDWLHPNAASEVVAAWHSGVTKAQYRLAMVNRDGEPNGRYLPRTMNDSDAMELVRRFGAYGSPPASGNAFDTQFLRKIMPLDESPWRTAADTVPIVLAPMHGEIVSIPKTLGSYRLHRRVDSGDLLMGNAPDNLWQEYWRIASTKQFVRREMQKLALNTPAALAFAPWESRVVAMCLRFGGPASGPESISRPHLALQTIESTLRWPVWNWGKKLMLCAWLALIYLLPSRAARRLALRQKSSVGVKEKVYV